MQAPLLVWAVAASVAFAGQASGVGGGAPSPILPMFFAGPPAGRWFNSSEEIFVLQHSLAVIGAGGPSGPNGTLPAEFTTHEQVCQRTA
jgi:hypothetical protein